MVRTGVISVEGSVKLGYSCINNLAAHCRMTNQSINQSFSVVLIRADGPR